MPVHPPPNHEIQKTATEARQGEATGRIRWVLIASTVLVVVALVAAYWVA